MMRSERRWPAEWEPCRAVILAWPHAGTDWAYMLDEAQDCIARIAMAISRRAAVVMLAPEPNEPCEFLMRRGANLRRIIFVEMPTNDTWARDFGPISTVSPDGRVTINDFQFNGWGLKFAANLDNMITGRMLKMGLFPKADYRNELSFTLEGGSIDIDEDGTLLTTAECLLSPNRNGALSRKEIELKLRQTLGAVGQIWLEHGHLTGDDTDSHVDTLARFLPGGKIAYAACDRADDEHFIDLQHMECELLLAKNSKGDPYDLVPLYIPDAIYDEDGQRLPATYANFLLLNGAILLPTYGQPKYDQMAIGALAKAAPQMEIVPIDCRALIRQHGSLHCATMQLL
ncbi:MAG: agmatine deiminase family protein [Clostridium sp.]|nr:agmatine deiminase family protein [Clostridium sp.]